jgi:hypothetical protein
MKHFQQSRWLLILSIGSLTFATVMVAAAQSRNLAFTMSQVMSPQEMRETGVATLTPAQREALGVWLNKYTDRLARAISSNQQEAGRYGGVGSGHWIKEVSSNGAYITLEDGSLWEVNVIDRIDTAIWLPISNITVIVAKNSIGSFQYELVNTDDGEKALAHYLGTH